MTKNRRNFYRINYPYNSSPHILLGGRSLEVLNISENGILLRDSSTKQYKIGANIVGKIAFPGGESLVIWGSVKRVSSDSIAVQLHRNIPLDVIMAEQLRLIRLIRQKA